MAINLTEKYSPLIDQRFKLTSVTDAFAGKLYSWDGAKTIKVYSIDTVDLNDYDRSASANRFGTIAELGDTVQTLTLTQDKSFTFSIDHGNAADQLNVKHCNAQLKSNWDEVCTPNIDRYRLQRWASGAGLGAYTAAAPDKTGIMEAIFNAGAALSNAYVPRRKRTLFIRESLYVKCKLSSEILQLEPLGTKAVRDGSVGSLDGMQVVPVPDSLFPDGVYFLIKYKDATADPMKLKTLRVQKNPLGFDADVGECRYYHDAFVLDSKINGIYVLGGAGYTQPVTFGDSSGKVTLTCATSGATIKYTTDGTNPKTSDTALTYSAAVTLEAGQKLRAYAQAAGEIPSAVTETAGA